MKKQSDQVPDEKMSTANAAKVAGVDQRTVRRWFDEGLIGGDAIQIGSRTLRRVSRASLVAYLASRKNDGDQVAP
jgi:excisionase family DNA binding protein